LICYSAGAPVVAKMTVCWKLSKPASKVSLWVYKILVEAEFQQQSSRPSLLIVSAHPVPRDLCLSLLKSAAPVSPCTMAATRANYFSIKKQASCQYDVIFPEENVGGRHAGDFFVY